MSQRKGNTSQFPKRQSKDVTKPGPGKAAMEEEDKSQSDLPPNRSPSLPDGFENVQGSSVKMDHLQTNVRVESNNGMEVLIKWDALNSKPDGYEVTWSWNGGERRGRTSADEYLLDALEPGTLYTVSVAPFTEQSKSKESNPIHFFSAPLPPINVKLHRHEDCPESTLQVRFDDPDKQRKEYKVVLVDATNQNIIDNKVTKKLFYTFRKLKPGKAYEAYVQSQVETQNAENLLSKPVYADGEVKTVPGKVSNIRKVRIDGPLSWDKVEEATSYCVRVTQECGKAYHFTLDDCSMSLKRFQHGHKYTMAVAANNSAGRGRFSDPIDHITAPFGPSSIQVSHYRGSPQEALVVSIKSDDPENSHVIFAQAISDDVEVKDDVGAKSLTVLRGLKPGEMYKICAMPVKNELNGEKIFYSDLVQTYPGTPTGLDVNITDSTLVAKWDELSIAPMCYKVTINMNGKDVKVETTHRTTYKMWQLEPGSLYRVSVSAENEAGCGYECEPREVRTVPPPPTIMSVTHDMSSPQTTLLVMLEDDDLDGKIYIVRAESIAGSISAEDIFEGRKLAILRDLTPGDSYRIFSICEKEGLSSRKAHHLCAVQTYPATPSDLRVCLSNGALVAEWEKLSIRPSHYTVKINVNGTDEATLTTTYTRITRNNVKSSSIYGVSVAAVNDAGTGYFCEVIEVATDPLPPTNVLAKCNELSPATSMVVKYTDPETVAKTYEISAVPATGPIMTVKTSQKSVILNDLLPGQSYKVFVVAVVGEDKYCRKSPPAFFSDTN